MPKIITGKCGHRCSHLYIRSRIGGSSTFEPAGLVYCTQCDKIYHKDEIEYERTVRIRVNNEKGKLREIFVINIPNNIRLGKKPDKRGDYVFAEEEFTKLKVQIERSWGMPLKEVVVNMEIGGIALLTEGKLIPSDTPIKKRGWGEPYDMTLKDYEVIEKKMKRVRKKTD
jgi:hypothetical protein